MSDLTELSVFFVFEHRTVLLKEVKGQTQSREVGRSTSRSLEGFFLYFLGCTDHTQEPFVLKKNK